MDEPLGALDALTREKMPGFSSKALERDWKNNFINYPFCGRGCSSW